MTQCNSVNIKLSHSQLNKLKSATQNKTRITLRLSSDIVDCTNNETDFPYKLTLIVANKAFANNSKIVKRLYKII